MVSRQVCSDLTRAGGERTRRLLAGLGGTDLAELMRFDRVITNPPFSQNYSADGIPHPERFPYGFCPESGKKADLMFVQHMVSVLRQRARTR